MKVFRSLVYVRTPGVRDRKIDTKRIHSGIFLGFTLTARNIRYEDKVSKRTKIARHFVVDEAHYSLPHVLPPYATDLVNYKQQPKKVYHPDDAKEVTIEIDKNMITPAAAKVEIDLDILDDLFISQSSYGKTERYDVNLKGSDSYLGFRFKYNDKKDIIIDEILLRTTVNRIPRWRSDLKFSKLISIDGSIIDTIKDVAVIISEAIKSNKKKLTFEFTLFKKVSPVLKSLASEMAFD